MMKWKNVTDTFSEKQRYYKEKYLEIDEVYDDALEVSVFSAVDGPYEIYFSYDKFYGIVYAKEENAFEIRDKMKRDLKKEYEKNKNVTDEFIEEFSKKYDVSLPMDLFFNFDFDAFLDELMKLE